MSAATGANGVQLVGELPKLKDEVTVIGTVKSNDKGYTLTLEAVKRGDTVILGLPKAAEKK